MSSENDQEIEYKLNEEYAIPYLNNIKNITRIQSPMRLFVFRQYKQEEIEYIKEFIFLRVGNSLFFKLRQLLTELYLNCKEQMIQQKRKYFDENNIFLLFLLNIQIEIDVRLSSISNIILPIAFKNYIDKQKYRTQSYCQQYEIDQLLLKKICSDFEVDIKKIDYSKLYIDCWYNLFQILSKQSLNQKNQKYLDQFLQEVISNSKQNEKMEKQPNQQFMYGEQYNNQQLDSQNYTSIKQKVYTIVQLVPLIQQKSKKQSNKDYKNQIQEVIDQIVESRNVFLYIQKQFSIISKCSNSMIPLGKDNIIYYNQKYDVKLSKMYNKRILCTGDLDYNYELQGEGVFEQIDLYITYEGQFDQGLQSGQGKQILLNQQYEGQFRQGQKQGFLIVTDLKSQSKTYTSYEYDTLKWKYQDKDEFAQQQQQQKQMENIIDREIIQSKNMLLSDMILKTLNIGQFLKDQIIDYYLVQMQNHYKQLHKEQINYIIINTMNCQDIFSSQLNYVNFDYHNLPIFINLKLLKALVETDITGHKDKLMRTIFVINLNRSHFITIVIENFEIYILNSISSNLVELCEIFKQAYKSINKQLYYKPDDYEIQIHQQNNFYSCGVHTCYIINQLIKYHNIPLKKIKFNNTNQVIDDYTTQMKNVILTRGSIYISRQIL